MTKIVGIFGYPIGHTLSPVMHNAAFRNLGLKYTYLPFEVHPDRLRKAADSIRSLNLTGVNITIPHKERIMRYINKIDPLAKQIGSVNTVVNKNGILYGYNTDVKGFLKDLLDKGKSIKGKTALLIGAGGAGRAIAAALAFANIKKIYIADLDEKRAKNLAHKTKNAVFTPNKTWKKITNDIDILINATPVGMHKGDPSPVPLECLNKNLFVYDVVYNRVTKLLELAKKAKAISCGGLGMLLYQGALAFELWTGKKAPVQVMRRALVKQLG